MSFLDDYSLSAEQRLYAECAGAFAREVIAPRAAEFDQHQLVPRDVLLALAGAGYTGANVGPRYGGSFVDNICVGLLHREIGASCTSVRSILTVHGMVCEAVGRWGTPAQKTAWLPMLASGAALGAFALTERQAGSDARNLSTTAVAKDGMFVLSGQKQWITAGEIADVFLVVANCEAGAAGFLVTPNMPGFTRSVLRGMLGQRAAMLASLEFDRCEVPASHRIGPAGLGLDAVAGSALDFGRYTVAWGCVGIGQACLEICMRHTADRHQFGRPLSDNQLVRAIITEMLAGVRCSGLLCMHAGKLRDRGEPDTLRETCLAKYVASRMCAEAASNAVQLHGAHGCTSAHAAQRHYRDAKIMEIIEGSTQIQQTLISRLAYDTFE